VVFDRNDSAIAELAACSNSKPKLPERCAGFSRKFCFGLSAEKGPGNFARAGFTRIGRDISFTISLFGKMRAIRLLP
jgi:hypothetical protein